MVSIKNVISWVRSFFPGQLLTPHTLADHYFEEICQNEFAIEQINNQITALEIAREDFEHKLDCAHILYSLLITKE